MTVANKISKEVMGWTSVAMIVVIASIVLLNFKGSDILCRSGYTYNTTADNCYLTTNASVTESAGGLGTTIDSFVTAFSEPANWVAIVIIAVIGIAILYFFNKKNN